MRRAAVTIGRRLAFVAAPQASDVGAGRADRPVWPTDGRRLTYVSDETGVADFYVLDLGSGGVTPLTADPAVDAAPAFTANGKNVVFTSNRSGVELLWRTPAAGPAPGPPAMLVSTPFATSATARPEPGSFSSFRTSSSGRRPTSR